MSLVGRRCKREQPAQRTACDGGEKRRSSRLFQQNKQKKKKKKIIFDFFKSSGKTQTSEAKRLATKEKMKIAHQMFSRGRALLFALRDVDEDFIVGA
jgi:hypothetical protein